MAKKKESLLIVILLSAVGLFFRDIRALFAVFSISLILLSDLYILNKKIEKILGDSSFKRITDNKIVIRGKITSVQTEFDIKIPDGVKIYLEDLIPKGAVVTSGKTEISSITDSGNHKIRYDLMCQAHGSNKFEGFKLSISDSFFSKDIVLRNNKSRTPEVMVYPKSSFIKSAIPSFSGKATDKKTIIQGEGVKGLREYNIHDDIRTVDWKASAKYDKLFVREYSGLEKVIQTVLIDLPDSEYPLSKEKAEVIKGIAGSIMINGDKIKKVSIILISGPNLIEVIKSPGLHEEALSILNKIKPSIRDKYLYKFSPKNYIKTYRAQNTFIQQMSDKAGFYFKLKPTHIFEKQIYGLFRELGTGEDLLIITIPETEISHFRIINELARVKNLRTCCFIPADENPDITKKFISSCGFDEVNLI